MLEKTGINKTKSDSFLLWLAQGFGTGRAPWAPGSVATAAIAAVWWLTGPFSVTQMIIAIIAVFVIGVFACERAMVVLGVHDHRSLVIDEYAGFLVTMIAVPHSLPVLALGFFLFRLFDVFKPWPINWIDRKISGGFGVMIDDVAAGLVANLVLQLLLMLFPVLSGQ